MRIAHEDGGKMILMNVLKDIEVFNSLPKADFM